MFLNFHMVCIGLCISALHLYPSTMAAQTWPPFHRNLKPFLVPQVQHRTIEVWYTVHSVISKLFETQNNLKPGSRSGYKHMQVIQKGIYPRAPSALVLCSVSSLLAPMLPYLCFCSPQQSASVFQQFPGTARNPFCPDYLTAQVIWGLTVKSWHQVLYTWKSCKEFCKPNKPHTQRSPMAGCPSTSWLPYKCTSLFYKD